jgi:type 2 lantibiotic biosynthesis protein LanM
MLTVNHPLESSGLASEQLIEEAVAIAERIAAESLTDQSGNVNWLTYSYDRQLAQRRRQWMNFHLYDGVCGTALFLAAVARVTDLPAFRSLATSVLGNITTLIQDSPRQFFQYGTGAAVGTASVIFTLTKAAVLLDDETLLRAARQLAEHITPADISGDSALDLMSGSAGCLMGLLALHQPLPQDGWLLDKAVACGEHLLQRRDAGPHGSATWKVNGQFMTGFAHGAAGISYALTRLYAATHEERFCSAALEACDFASSMFSTNALNWRQSNESGRFFNRWCHGAAGIGLGRLGMLRVVDSESVRSDIHQALLLSQDYRLTTLDYPCCGNFGVMELFLVAGETMSYPSAAQCAHKIANGVVDRARLRNAYALEPGEEKFNPSFHQGMAGIGYQLLRLAKGKLFPSVLLWQ